MIYFLKLKGNEVTKPDVSTVQLFQDVLSQSKYAMALTKLNQFRRHPDWIRAHERVRQTRREFFTLIDDGEFKGRWAIHEDDAEAFLDAVDQEFIDEIIRKDATCARADARL